MDKIAFNALDLETKGQLVFQDGQFLECIDYYGFRVCLYSVNSSFIEVYYEPKANEIEKIEFVDEEALRKFESRIVLNLDPL